LKLIVQADLTLDGVMQSPGMPDEDRSSGFDHGGWLVPFADDVFQETRRNLIRASDGLLLGRKTYEIRPRLPYVRASRQAGIWVVRPRRV